MTNREVKTAGSNIKDHEYKYLCIGTSCIMALEAIYLSETGESVLMVDRDQTFGGAWKTIEISGISDVENAIHYFLPNEKAIEFMRFKLNWPVEPSKAKYRYFKLLGKHYLKFSYDSTAGRLLHKIFYSSQKIRIYQRTSHIFNSIIQTIFQKQECSYYVSYGSAGMLKSLTDMLSKKNVDIWYQSLITDIVFDIKNKKVKCIVDGKEVTASKLILGHGARLPLLKSKDEDLKLEEKFYPRPAFHLVMSDNKEEDALEVVLTSDSLVKYVHNVTRFTSLTEVEQKVQKVFVFALQSDVLNHKNLAEDLRQKLVDLNMIHADAYIIASRYTHVILPTLCDEDLYAIKKTFGDLVGVIKTEDFTAGVGYFVDRWSS